jgi:hypothetical protein
MSAAATQLSQLGLAQIAGRAALQRSEGLYRDRRANLGAPNKLDTASGLLDQRVFSQLHNFYLY